MPSTATNLALGFPNRAWEATYSGGSWLASLPASNAGNRDIARVARSTDATTASTKMILDLGATRALRFFALIATNLGANAQWKVDIGTTSGGTESYAGSLATAWPMATTQAAMSTYGIEQDAWRADNWLIPLVLPTYYSGRYVTVSMSDTGNADGYVEVGAVFAGGGLVPTYNASYGLQKGRKDLSTKTYAESGAQWGNSRRRLRPVQFVLETMPLAEMVMFEEMDRQLGIIDDVLYLPDISDLVACQRDGFMGTLRELSMIEYPYPLHQKKALAMEERL